MRRLPVLLVEHLRSELVVHLPQGVEGHLQLGDVFIRGGVVRPVMPHVDVPVQLERVPFVVREAELVRAVAVGVEFELVIGGVLERVHHGPVLVLHHHVEDVVAHVLVHDVERPDEGVALAVRVQVEALLVVAADGHLQRIGGASQGPEHDQNHRTQDRRSPDVPQGPAAPVGPACASRRLDHGAGHRSYLLGPFFWLSRRYRAPCYGVAGEVHSSLVPCSSEVPAGRS